MISESELIKITDKENKYVTTFKTINNKFIQENPKYNSVQSEAISTLESRLYFKNN